MFSHVCFLFLLTFTDADTGESWILCRVDRYVGTKRNNYIVSDVAPEDNAAEKSFDLPRKALVPLPKMVPRNWDEQTEYAKGDMVMALFPGTTSFYEATVIDVPSSSDDRLYSLQFEDDDDEQGGTPIRQIRPALVVASQAGFRRK